MSQHVFAVYDVSASSVAGAHVLHTESQPVVLASIHTQNVLQKEIQPARLFDSTIANLTSAIDAIKAADIHQPTQITVVLASPWYVTQTHTVVQKKDTPFVCTQEMIDQLVHAEIQNFIKEQQGAFSVFGSESTLLEKHITSIKLNGYPTSKPFGKKAVLIECTVTITVAPASIIQKFTETIQRSYGVRPIQFTSNMFSDFFVVRDIEPAQYDSAVIVDVREELTDIAFIKDGNLLYHHSFSLGFYGMYRSIAEKMNISAQEAVTLLEAYTQKKLSDTETQKIFDVCREFQTSWSVLFRTVIDEGHYGFCLPQHCVVVTHQLFHSMFTSSIFDDAFVRHQCAVGPVELSQLDTASLEKFIRSSNGKPIETVIAVGALYSSRMTKK